MSALRAFRIRHSSEKYSPSVEQIRYRTLTQVPLDKSKPFAYLKVRSASYCKYFITATAKALVAKEKLRLHYIKHQSKTYIRRLGGS